MGFNAGAWELAQVLVKCVVYACMAASVGGLLVAALLQQQGGGDAVDAAGWYRQQRRSLLRHVALAASQGLLFTLLLYLLQVGAILRAGLVGMFDPTFIRALAATAVGTGCAAKAAGFVLALVAVLGVAPRVVGEERRPLPPWLWAAGSAALLLFASSFAVLGHVAPLRWPLQLAVMVHVAAVLLWVGALLPLRRLCASGPLPPLQALLRQFGMLGWGLVAAVLLGGLTVLWQLVGTVDALFTTAYGLTLLSKLLLASGLFALAALNKFRLVPTLAEPTRDTLRISIGWELTLALGILALTAVLTTLTGPPD